jgi:hypothetical protein
MAVLAGRPVFDGLIGCIGPAIAVKFRFFVTLHAHHTPLVMNIRRLAIIPRILRIDTTAMTEGARLTLVLLHKFVPLKKTETDAAHRRGLDVAVTAGSVTTAAGLLKNLGIKGLHLFLRKPGHDAVTQARCRVMKRLGIGIGDFSVTHAAGL